MCSAIGAIGAIGEGVLTNRIRLCILDMSVRKLLRRSLKSVAFIPFAPAAFR